VLRFVGQHPDGVRAAEVAIGLSLDREQVRVYLNRLLDAGKVTRPSRGVYKPTVTCVTSVTFPDPEVPERNTRNTRNTTYTEDSEPDAKCTVCGGRLIISEIGQTTHPGCEADR
jgi:DNA-binding IclR family transcriptional regulator